MSKYSKYPSYKDCGVEWLGEIPEHWEDTRLKFLGYSYGGLSGKAGKDFNQEENKSSKPFIPFTNIANSPFIKDDYFGLVIIKEDEHQNKAKKGDLFFLMSSEGYEDLGKSSLLDFEVDELYLNSFCKGFRITKENILPKYLNYLLQGDTYRKLLYTQGNGFTRINLRLEKLNDLGLMIAPLQEQKAIATYLDRATQKIDSLIAKQSSLIALLKEKRQALISHAVTKGVENEELRMKSEEFKDSGVEWLGEIPEGWEVVAIKRLSTIGRGASPRPIDNPIYFDDEGEFSWVRIADVSKTNGYLNETLQQLSKLGSSLSVKIYPGEIFVSIAGTVGKPCISNIKACIHDGFVYFPQLSEHLIKFIFRIFEAGECYLGLGKMGTQLNLNTETIGSIHIALPPKEVVAEVIQYLDQKTQKIDTLITKATEAITLLKEKRTALISAVVTGKIDVRGEVT